MLRVYLQLSGISHWLTIYSILSSSVLLSTCISLKYKTKKLSTDLVYYPLKVLKVILKGWYAKIGCLNYMLNQTINFLR